MGKLDRIAVIGAGPVGHGIAQVFATAGHAVTLHAADPASLASADSRIRSNLRALGHDEAAAGRVTVSADFGDTAAADFVVEAAAEDLAVRSWPLFEVVGTEWTDPEVLAGVLELHRGIGKTAIHVRRDVPGYTRNRLQGALWREAVAIVQDGICDAETLDTVVKASFGRRLAALGTLENAELIGTDLALAIHRVLLPDLDRIPTPLPLLERLVAEGRLGAKSRAGFRDWTEAELVALRRRLFEHLKRGLEPLSPPAAG